jgi:hypothetical protein
MISKVSLLLNLGLAAGVICLLLRERRADSKGATQLTTKIATSSTPQAGSTFAASVSAETLAQPFRWASIESTNYRTYIANLRGIECPERTIRDLITADVDASVYSPTREQLKQKLEGKIKAAPEGAVFAQDEYERGLERLKAEEAALIASLLGMQNPEASAGAVVSRSHGRNDQPAEMPLVFQDVDPSALHLTDSQAAIINEIRQDFLQQVGGPNQDPNDPAYRQRWLPAQRQADDMLKGMLGSTFVQNYQLHLMEQTEQAKQ